MHVFLALSSSFLLPPPHFPLSPSSNLLSHPQTPSLYENELSFVDRLIGMDVRNNSAWNQRYFVLNHTGWTDEVIERELKYVMNRIQLVKNNESTWNYLRALLEHGTGKLDQHPEVCSMSTSSLLPPLHCMLVLFS